MTDRQTDSGWTDNGVVFPKIWLLHANINLQPVFNIKIYHNRIFFQRSSLSILTKKSCTSSFLHWVRRSYWTFPAFNSHNAFHPQSLYISSDIPEFVPEPFINPLPNTTILQQTTLAIFCQKIENLYNWMDNLWLKLENIVAKGEIARFE